MYVVRLREAGGKVAQKVEFPDVRDALRHMDAFVQAFPTQVSEVHGKTGLLFRYDPSDCQPAAS